MRARKRLSCSSCPTSSQNLMRMMPASVMYFSISGQMLEKALSLLLADETHHPLDTCAIVPTAIENDDFAGRRKVLDVALKKHLGLFADRRAPAMRRPGKPAG